MVFDRNPQAQSAILSSFSPWRPIGSGDPVDHYRLSLSPMMIDKPYKNKVSEIYFLCQILRAN